MVTKEKDTGWGRQSRDLLIRLNEKVENLTNEVKDMRDSTKETISDHETRLRFLERSVWLAVGALAILQIALKYLLP